MPAFRAQAARGVGGCAQVRLQPRQGMYSPHLCVHSGRLHYDEIGQLRLIRRGFGRAAGSTALASRFFGVNAICSHMRKLLFTAMASDAMS
jgi:hypothetical protein